jgi:hypothetical protein
MFTHRRAYVRCIFLAYPHARRVVWRAREINQKETGAAYHAMRTPACPADPVMGDARALRIGAVTLYLEPPLSRRHEKRSLVVNFTRYSA